MPQEKLTTARPHTKTPEQALSSLMRQCARAERCSSDALRSMRRWGVEEGEAQRVLQRLRQERFIDDSRYADAYVREKMRFSGWGVRKIRAALRAKAIDAEYIDRALAQIEPNDSRQRLEEMLQKKAAKTTSRDNYDLKGKLVRFALSRGFDLDDVLEISERVIRSQER